jgi:DNA polymerase elongation subunit (family B)
MKYQHFIVFDIETVAEAWDSFDEFQQEYLLRGAQTDEDRDKKRRELALSPMTSRVVCIGIAVMQWSGADNDTAETLKEGVLILDPTLRGTAKRRQTLSTGVSAVFSDEAQVLGGFWNIMKTYHDTAHIVTFNGIEFDAPFLMLRSAVCGVRPSRNLTGGKPWELKERHIDLQKELTLHAFGSGNSGATRKYNFDFYARVFGIESPKSQGVHGGNVAELFAEGRLIEIAEYCMRDVTATWQLFRSWHKYLHFGE